MGEEHKKRSDKIVCLPLEKSYIKKEKKNRAKPCRFKTTAWASLLPVERKTKRVWDAFFIQPNDCRKT
ncbi:hypothetical protein BPJM79_120020 [Bacillus pumilus]